MERAVVVGWEEVELERNGKGCLTAAPFRRVGREDDIKTNTVDRSSRF